MSVNNIICWIKSLVKFKGDLFNFISKNIPFETCSPVLTVNFLIMCTE